MKIGILTNGSIVDYSFYKDKIDHYDLIICADGGLAHAMKMDIIPQVALGDFDSTTDHVIQLFKSKGTEIIRYSTIKNETDTEIALLYALAQKPDAIDILAGLGSRFDHSFGNVHLLKKAADLGVPCWIITENNEITLIKDKIKVTGEIGDGISLLPFTETVSHVYTSGLAYPVEDGEFHIGAPYGISNYMTKSKAEIKIDGGLLLVMKYRE